jgi:thiamine biosynthesis lipoprotein
MGTVVSFHVYPGDCPEPAVRAGLHAACRRLHELDALFSTWDPHSPMSKLRSGGMRLGEAAIEIALVIEWCRRGRDLSGGWFDPWAMPGGFDPTGRVKGWAVEQALECVQSAGVEAAMVNGGGDIALAGRPPGEEAWRLGIRHPWQATALACVIESEVAVATSGRYERPHHLFDPRAGRAVSGAPSATVIGPRLALADAFATAVAVGGDEAFAMVEALEGYEVYLIREDGSERTTEGIVFV